MGGALIPTCLTVGGGNFLNKSGVVARRGLLVRSILGYIMREHYDACHRYENSIFSIHSMDKS